MSFLNILEPIANIIKDPLVEWQKRKTIKTEAKLKVDQILAEAQIAQAEVQKELAKQGALTEADYDRTAQQQMQFSWKDEYLTLLFTLPLIASFIPTIQDYIAVGWEYIDKAPRWYIYILLGIVAASFGLRWLIRPLLDHMMNNRKGK